MMIGFRRKRLLENAGTINPAEEERHKTPTMGKKKIQKRTTEQPSIINTPKKKQTKQDD